eukprot:TRINITY_DN11167_c0_g1_i2.p1 TRINITY_DN11167_c0_g1~~TRINITY_DN11167_c0_g1_i2.p1  ORF type:complete len:691 (+),score=101.97 TRINITY_DN11167_c0_g1_i2:52-2073(+)
MTERDTCDDVEGGARSVSGDGEIQSVGNHATSISDLLKACVQSELFEGFIGILIIGNCVTLGFEAELLLGNMMDLEAKVRASDAFFTIFFTVELLFRFLVLGWRAYVPASQDNKANAMDAILVVVTFVVWFLPLVANDSSSGRSPLLRSFTALRAIRLVRLVRVVQRVPFFREVWLLIRGLTHSIRVLFWTICVVFFITYVFAIFGVVLVSVDVKDAIVDSEVDHTHQLTADILHMLWESTGSVWMWMQTLIQVLTLDSWNSIMRPLMHIAPFAWILFYFYIAIAVIVLLNLVTAIIVENAFKFANLDEKEQALLAERLRLESMENLKELFKTLDDDGSGEISWEEFESGYSKPEIRLEMEKLEIRHEDLKPMFDLLDTGDGSLSMKEFFDGIQRVRGVATAKETFGIAKRLEFLITLVERNTSVVELMLSTSEMPHGHRMGRTNSNGINSDHTSSPSTSPRHIRRRRTVDFPPSPRSTVFGETANDLTQGSVREINGKLERMMKDFRAQISLIDRQVSNCMESIGNIFDTKDVGSIFDTKDVHIGTNGEVATSSEQNFKGGPCDVWSNGGDAENGQVSTISPSLQRVTSTLQLATFADECPLEGPLAGPGPPVVTSDVALSTTSGLFPLAKQGSDHSMPIETLLHKPSLPTKPMGTKKVAVSLTPSLPREVP